MKIIRREDITTKGSPIKHFDVDALCHAIEKMPKDLNGNKRIYVGHTSNDTYPIGIIDNPCVSPDYTEYSDWISILSYESHLHIDVLVENSYEYHICDKDWTNDDTAKPINLSDFIKEKPVYTYNFYDKNDEDGILIPGDIIRLTLVSKHLNLQKVYGIITDYSSDLTKMMISFVDPSLVKKWKMDHTSIVTKNIQISTNDIWNPDVEEFEIERLHR